MLGWALRKLFGERFKSWFINHVVLTRGLESRRGAAEVGSLEDVARQGAAACLLAQEKARLQYVSAKEAYCEQRTFATFELMLECLIKLQSTNALVQSLLNEHALERLLSTGDKGQTLPPVRKSA
jgi:hypothetical protein